MRPPLVLEGVARGARDLLGATPAVFAFGVGFGAAAITAGLTPVAALSMSGLVFAGASQYAALELWPATPLIALALTALLVNARHLVLGATLRPWLAEVPALQRYAALALLSDANWAATTVAVRRGERALGHLVGGGMVLWVTWVAGTALGAFGGARAGMVERYALDVLMPAFFACTLLAGPRSVRAAPPWLVAGGVTILAALVIAPHWAVLAGALAGGLSGLFVRVPE